MKQRKIPARMCVSCREMKPKKELARVVRSPAGTVTIDGGGKAAGRGAYICKRHECVGAAKKGRRLEKNLDVADCAQIYAELLPICDAAEEEEARRVAESARQAEEEARRACESARQE